MSEGVNKNILVADMSANRGGGRPPVLNQNRSSLNLLTKRIHRLWLFFVCISKKEKKRKITVSAKKTGFAVRVVGRDQNFAAMSATIVFFIDAFPKLYLMSYLNA